MSTNFEKREPYLGRAPTPTLDAASSDAIVREVRPEKFKKILVMNVVGALLWACIGFALFSQKMEEQPTSVLMGIVILYIIIVGIPAGTAIALSLKGESGLRSVMVWMNWALIFMGIVSFAAAFFFAHVRINVIGAPLIFFIPEALNIRALSKQSRMFRSGRGVRR